MGKRQIGELQPSELVVAIMISDLASVPMSDSSIPLLYGIVPMLTLVFSEVFLSYLSLKSPIIRQIATGRPTYIINNGKINQKEMKKARYSISDLLEELRMLNVFDIASVHCALLETNGKISVVTTECADDREYVIVRDGSVQKNVLSSSPFSEKDLKKFLGKKNIKDVFLLSVDSKGKIYCVMKGE